MKINHLGQIVLYIGGALLVSALVLGGAYLISRNLARASVQTGNAYYSTSTDSTWASSQALAGKTLAYGPGMFGSVVITSSTGGTMTFFDATTTVNGGIAAYATTTLATFGASVAAGTYTFDTSFSRGLLVTFSPSTGAGTTTITWKP